MHPLRPVHVLLAAGAAELGVFVTNSFNLVSLLLGGLTVLAAALALPKGAPTRWTWAAAIAGVLAAARLVTFRGDPGILVALVALSAALYLCALVLLAVQRRVPARAPT